MKFKELFQQDKTGDVPEKFAEADFHQMKPEKEIAEESTREEIIDKIIERSKSDSINPMHYFNYKGAFVKIGDLKNLEKLMYEIQFGDKIKEGHEYYKRDEEEEFKEVIGKIIDETNSLIQEDNK